MLVNAALPQACMSEKRRLTVTMHVRVSTEELAILRERAAHVGMSLAGFFRAAALGRRTQAQSPELLRGLADLGRLCGLLQAALRQPDAGGLHEQIAQALAATREVGAELRRRR